MLLGGSPTSEAGLSRSLQRVRTRPLLTGRDEDETQGSGKHLPGNERNDVLWDVLCDTMYLQMITHVQLYDMMFFYIEVSSYFSYWWHFNRWRRTVVYCRHTPSVSIGEPKGQPFGNESAKGPRTNKGNAPTRLRFKTLLEKGNMKSKTI